MRLIPGPYVATVQDAQEGQVAASEAFDDLAEAVELLWHVWQDYKGGRATVRGREIDAFITRLLGKGAISPSSPSEGDTA